MAIYTKRGNMWKYIITRVVDGKSKPIRKGGFKTKKEAVEAALQMELDLMNGVLDPQKDYPLEKYFKCWYETYKKNISNITLIPIKRHMLRFQLIFETERFKI